MADRLRGRLAPGAPLSRPLVLLLGLCSLAAAPDEQAPCRARGEAPIVKRDRGAAKARAVSVALARCAESLAGELMSQGRVGSGLSEEDRARALAALGPRLAKETSRLFLSTRVLHDRAESGWVHVEVEASVRLEPLLDAARAAALGLMRGQAIVGVVVYEAIHTASRVEVRSDSMLGAQLARALHDRGYEGRLVRFEPAVELPLLDDPRALAARARLRQVELLVAAEVALIDDASSPLDRSRSVAIEARLQVVEAATGKVRGRVPFSTRLTAETAVNALRIALGAGGLDKVLSGLTPLLAVEAARPSVGARTITMTFTGLPDFRAAREVLELMKIVPGVKGVDERDYLDGRLDAELEWAGTLDELELELTAELARHRTTRDLRVVQRAADRLVLAR